MQYQPSLNKTEELLRSYDRQSSFLSRCIIAALCSLILILIGVHVYVM